VRLGDGRRLFYRTRRNTLTVPRVRQNVGARISIRGVLDSGMTGRSAVTRAKHKAG
jgi:hypothetical protein